jgi:hypothetical protein
MTRNFTEPSMGCRQGDQLSRARHAEPRTTSGVPPMDGTTVDGTKRDELTPSSKAHHGAGPVRVMEPRLVDPGRVTTPSGTRC